ncbi:MAG: hypothetical protein QF609_00905 [Gammaproteobacteria bacterium]|nr:hypothetical protein [Gammaproteobacteria bacterium]
MVRLAINQYDSVIFFRPLSKLAGGHEAANASTEYEGRVTGHHGCPSGCWSLHQFRPDALYAPGCATRVGITHTYAEMVYDFHRRSGHVLGTLVGQHRARSHPRGVCRQRGTEGYG